MAEKWDQIVHILEREDKEFKEAMTGQVGTIFPRVKGLNIMASSKMFTTQGTTRKKSKLGHACP